MNFFDAEGGSYGANLILVFFYKQGAPTERLPFLIILVSYLYLNSGDQ
jgi:hypothetical protein